MTAMGPWEEVEIHVCFVKPLLGFDTVPLAKVSPMAKLRVRKGGDYKVTKLIMPSERVSVGPPMRSVYHRELTAFLVIHTAWFIDL